MKNEEIGPALVAELDAALPAGVGVRTAGGDSTDTPPYVVVRWRANRIRENGANPLGEIVRDDSGTATGREYHQYFRVTADLTVTSYDEEERDALTDLIDDAFLPYEYDPAPFHSDTFEWEVGDSEPGAIPVVEPDWYEARKLIRFKFLKRVTRDADPLETVWTDVHSDDSR